MFFDKLNRKVSTALDNFTSNESYLLSKNVNDFELLVSLGVFNSALMNDAVYKFKRYK